VITTVALTSDAEWNFKTVHPLTAVGIFFAELPVPVPQVSERLRNGIGFVHLPVRNTPELAFFSAPQDPIPPIGGCQVHPE
jgi:hypothetical protein